MELRQLRYFIALAEERNFGRAAERLSMTQPPLTRQIRSLEEELCTTLFVRTPKGVNLTDAGQALLESVPHILQLTERAKERAQFAGKGLMGHLGIGVFGSGILNIVPRAIAGFRRQRPDVTIGLHTMTKDQQIEALRERRISVGFARVVPAEAEIAVEHVLREPFLVALHESHPLCEKAEITVHDLDSEPMILYPSIIPDGLAQSVAEAFRCTDARLRVVQEVEDVLTAIALVSGEVGLCVTTESASSLRLPGVVYRPFKSPHLRDIEMSCFYRRDDTSPLLASFLKVVRAHRAPVAAPASPDVRVVPSISSYLPGIDVTRSMADMVMDVMTT